MIGTIDIRGGANSIKMASYGAVVRFTYQTYLSLGKNPFTRTVQLKS